MMKVRAGIRIKLTLRKLRKLIKENDIKFIKLQFSDILGQIKIVNVSVDELDDILGNGIWFDGSSIQGFAGIAESDTLLRPDLSTFAVIPWSDEERKTARFICDSFQVDNGELETDPRHILRKQLEKARKMGYEFKVGAEFEFYMLNRSELPKLVPHDHKGYFDYTPQSRALEVCEKTMLSLGKFGIKREVHHHEVGPGQHEIDIRFDDAVIAADDILTLKLTIKAHTNGTTLKTTWMPKPITGLPGNGMHIHQSLWQNGNNVFYDKDDEYGLSKIAKQFLAGQLHNAKALSAIVSPTVNSYKRLIPGFEAPVYICWGKTNRSSLIRIPHSSTDKAEVSARIEYRAPDTSANPYLAFAALLAAGLDGIDKDMKVPDPVEENVYTMSEEDLEQRGINRLPGDLRAAIHFLEKNTSINKIFGKSKDIYIKIKIREWEEFMKEVSLWEVARYL